MKDNDFEMEVLSKQTRVYHISLVIVKGEVIMIIIVMLITRRGGIMIIY